MRGTFSHTPSNSQARRSQIVELDPGETVAGLAPPRDAGRSQRRWTGRERSADERTLIEVIKQAADIFVHLDAPGRKQIFAAPASCGHADRPDLCFACRLGVVGGIAQRKYLVRFQAKTLEGRLEDIRMRFGMFRIVGGRLFLDQIFHLRNLLVDEQVCFAGGSCERKPDASIFQLQQELTYAGNGFDLVQVLLLKDKAAELLQRFFDVLTLPPRHEDGNELVTTFADLPAHVFKFDMDANCAKRYLPRLRVQPVALDERSIDITQYCLNHLALDAPYTNRVMNVTELSDQFGLSGVLKFEDHDELTRAQVKLSTCSATIYLQGAHLAEWHPVGSEPVLFLSEHSAFKTGKAIRGGVPICFPWFGPRSDGGSGPSHGFARVQPWELVFAALMPDSGEGDRLQMTFILGPTDLSRSLGYDQFRAVYEVLLGRQLTLRLTVANLGSAPMKFEEALHSYFKVGDIHRAPLTGLESADYLDKRDQGRSKTAVAGPLQLREFSDQVYPANASALAIHDEANHRLIHIEKQQSETTVVWNPWPEGSAPLADLGPEEWRHFLCVEAANTATDAITLAPGATHTMVLTLSVSQNGQVE